MYSNEHTLQELLKRCYHRLDMDDTVTEMEVVRVYRQVVGDLISRLTSSAKFSKGTLTIKLRSAALRQELFYRRQSMADKINDGLGKTVVKQIVML